MDKTFLTIADFCRLYSVGRTKTHELIKAQAFESVKIGRARRIVAASAKAWADSLGARPTN